MKNSFAPEDFVAEHRLKCLWAAPKIWAALGFFTSFRMTLYSIVKLDAGRVAHSSPLLA
jgi:hypothetical protein